MHLSAPEVESKEPVVKVLGTGTGEGPHYFTAAPLANLRA